MSTELIIFLSFIFTSIFGVLFHFAHKHFPKRLIVHIFCPVNESVWEHTKLTFSPMLIAGLVQIIFLGEKHSNINFAVLISIIAGVLLVPFIYYPIRYLNKKEILWVSIAIFYIVVIISYLIEYVLLINNTTGLPESNSLNMMLFLIVIYALLTFSPPKWGIFKDSIKKKYGDFK